MKRIKQKGFTLIEFVMVTFIIGFLSVIVGQILLEAYRSFLVMKDTAEISYQSLLGAQRICEDVHRLRSPNDFTTLSATSLAFNDVGNNSVSYQLSGSLLTRSGQTLASDMSSISFGYLTSNGAATTTSSAVRYVTVTVSTSKNGNVSTISTMCGTRASS